MTVIALSLTKIAFIDYDFINNAHAQSNKIQKIAICDSSGYRCVQIGNDGKLNVK